MKKTSSTAIFSSLRANETSAAIHKKARMDCFVALLLVMTVVFTFIFAKTSHAQRSDSIAAVVNGDIITFTNLYDRMKLVMSASGMPDTPEFRERLTNQILTALITETIQLQEAEAQNITVEDSDIDAGFAELAAQNNFQPEQFAAILDRQDVSMDSLKNQIEAQVAWRKVIQEIIRPRVGLTDTDIQSEIERLEAREGEVEYLLSEIYLPIDERNANADVKKAADDITARLKSNPESFPTAARQLSQSATAARNGLIGWVSAKGLSDIIGEDKIREIESSDESSLPVILNPVLSDEGYLIITVQGRRLFSVENNAALEMEVENRLGTERLNVLQQRYLRDLIANAYIERRV
jgi:peptidyl-prolyl cis-trans isomerase SurA